jgi:hypothetical protein
MWQCIIAMARQLLGFLGRSFDCVLSDIGIGGVVMQPSEDPGADIGGLAVHRRPTASSPIVDWLREGDRVRVFGKCGDWYRIAHDKASGWAEASAIRSGSDYWSDSTFP